MPSCLSYRWTSSNLYQLSQKHLHNISFLKSALTNPSTQTYFFPLFVQVKYFNLKCSSAIYLGQLLKKKINHVSIQNSRSNLHLDSRFSVWQNSTLKQFSHWINDYQVLYLAFPVLQSYHLVHHLLQFTVFIALYCSSVTMFFFKCCNKLSYLQLPISACLSILKSFPLMWNLSILHRFPSHTTD